MIKCSYTDCCYKDFESWKILVNEQLILYVILLVQKSKREETRHATQKKLHMYNIVLNI